MFKKLTFVFTAILMVILSVGMSSCQKKLDVEKIKELNKIENPSSAQIDEMIDQVEIVINTPKAEIDKMNEDDQFQIASLLLTTMLLSESELSDDVKLSDAQKAKIKKLSEKAKDSWGSEEL